MSELVIESLSHQPEHSGTAAGLRVSHGYTVPLYPKYPDEHTKKRETCLYTSCIPHSESEPPRRNRSCILSCKLTVVTSLAKRIPERTTPDRNREVFGTGDNSRVKVDAHPPRGCLSLTSFPLQPSVEYPLHAHTLSDHTALERVGIPLLPYAAIMCVCVCVRVCNNLSECCVFQK